MFSLGFWSQGLHPVTGVAVSRNERRMVRDRNAVDGGDWEDKGFGIFFCYSFG